MDVVAEGPTLVLKMRDWSPEDSIYRQKSPTRSTQADVFEVAEVDAQESTTVELKLGGIGISFIDRRREVMYWTLRDVKFTFRDSSLYTTYGLVMKWLQMDNQLDDSPNRLILYPTVVPKDGKEVHAPPVFQAALVRSKDDCKL